MSSHVRKYMALFLMNQCFVVGIFNLRGRRSLFSFHNGEEMVLWRTAVQQWIMDRDEGTDKKIPQAMWNCLRDFRWFDECLVSVQ